MAKHRLFASLHRPARWKSAFYLGILLCAIGVKAQHPHIITFNVPEAGTASGQGTFPVGINALGVISGYYIDGKNVLHAFLRQPSGHLTVFDAPGAANQPGFGTIVHGMNNEGAVIGSYWDANKAAHAYLRSSDGKFTTFVSPKECVTGIATGCHGTGGYDVNDFGTIVGAYEDRSGNFVAHGYIRSRDGEFKVFAVPGSSMEAGQGTLPSTFSGLNLQGAVTGIYYDANNVFHGFLRSPSGTYTDFEAPGADVTDQFYGTFPGSLNDLGAIAGYYLDANGVYHGFLRGPEGRFTDFDAPGADLGTNDFNGTFPANINLLGVITGSYADANNIIHGFIRHPNGGFTTFDAPGAGTGKYDGTVPVANNLEGAITGSVYDDANVAHGFVRRP